MGARASGMTEPRRFLSPWTIDGANDACFIVRKKNGQALGYFCLEDEPGRRAAAKLLTRTRHGAWRRTSPSCRGY